MRQSLKTKDHDEALARFARWILAGSASTGGGPTVAYCWNVYILQHVQTDAVVSTSRGTIASTWKNLEPHFGKLNVAQVNQRVLDAYTAKRRKVARPATVRRELGTLLAALRFVASAKGGKLIAKDVSGDLTLPPNSPPRVRWLTMEEVQQLLDAAASMRRGHRLSRVERFIWLALFTTGRKQALLELTWDRVDFATNTIHLNVPGRRVTKKRRADVPIAAQLRPVLERAYTERLGKKHNLVLDHGGQIWTPLQYVTQRAGLSHQKLKLGQRLRATGISPHVFRHSGATHMARANVPLWKVAKTLGDSLATTERVYAKWAPDDPAGTVDRISNGLLRMPSE